MSVLAALRSRPVPLLGVVALVGSLAAAAPLAPSPDDDAHIVHALNRLGYGPRPGDVDKVRGMGLDRWIESQLHPERIPDAELPARLAALRTVGLSTHDLLKHYDAPAEVKKEAQKMKAERGGASDEETKRARRDLVKKYSRSMDGPPRRVIEELQQAKVIRAVYSERQLEEVLVDFWMNHFNVFAQKGPEKFLLAEYERDVVRRHAFGKFEDLLLATAESPAMLFYLDNWLSADPNAPDRVQRVRLGFGRRGRPFGFPPPGDAMRRPPDPSRSKRGLNENYARELMELHTLGVDGGYTQRDVTEVARCFTGWTIRGLPEQKPEFHFDDRLHDHGPKVVLGQAIKAGGEDQGKKVVHLLATHPSTARFISLKLARRLVADEPPPALVDRAARTFRETGGDIRAVVRTIVQSPEFFSTEARAAKVKTPLEFVVSAVRASRASVGGASELVRRIAAMGMPLYMDQPPTGYKDVAEAWVSTGGLLARLNFALDLAAGRLPGVHVDPSALVPEASTNHDVVATLAARLLPAGLSEGTERTLDREAGSGLDAARVAGLILGSPEFQRR